MYKQSGDSSPAAKFLQVAIICFLDKYGTLLLVSLIQHVPPSYGLFWTWHLDQIE